MKPRMTREQLRIYNAARKARGQTPLKADTTGDDAIETFQQQVDEVTPYTTGLQTSTDDPEYEKNIKQELDWISNSTQYLFNSVSAAQEAYDQAQEAAGDAKDAYDAAQKAQSDADAAQNDAIKALQEAEQNAKDIVTLQGDVSGINVELYGDGSGNAGLVNTVSNQGVQIQEVTTVTDEYTAQWSVKTTLPSGEQNGVGFYFDGTKTYFAINADVFAVFDNDDILMEEKNGVLYCYAPVDFTHIKGLYTTLLIPAGSGSKSVASFKETMWVSYSSTYPYFDFPDMAKPTLKINDFDVSDYVEQGLPWAVQVPAGNTINITWSNIVTNFVVQILRGGQVG